MINDILTAIMERLAEKEPNLKYLDEDYGQLSYYQENVPVKFPCALLELQQTSWKNQSQKAQDGVLNISIRVADLKLSNTNYKAPTTQKTKAAAIWIVIENIHKALHGWRPLANPEFGTLTRISTSRVKRDDGIREFELVYSSLCTDASAINQQFGTADDMIISVY
jgi:hypothetical protein